MNFVRNIGSSVAASMVTTLLARRAQAACGLLYRAMERQVRTIAYFDILWMLAIAASIMFLLSFIVRRNDPKARGEVAVG